MIAFAAAPAPALAQDPQDHQHEHANMPGMNDGTGWQFMQDGVVFALFNHQGGPRGGNEGVAPNWWMGMFTRAFGDSQLGFNTMFSLDPATAGTRGYREIFQVGEAVDGRPLIDRQHPHDFFMQLSASWRTPINESTTLTIAGGPAGEPALGPVAFMHRASAAEYPFATLSHHTFDSTHISFGVVTAAVERGPWTVEGSVFNGREPDQHRWDFDFAPLDSVSGRVWFRPSSEWEVQASTGRLVHPEELEPGNIQRTTVSASWLRQDAGDFNAVTFGYGINATDAAKRMAFFGEGTRHIGPDSAFVRMEVVQVETNVLIADAIPADRASAAASSTVAALTLGGVRDVLRVRGMDGGIGAAVTLHSVPDALKSTYGQHPVSFQLFFRLRPPAGAMGRMWNRRMASAPPMHPM
ncbi:MAG TPA: hypothetical protein VGY57_01385 [Vicinamibacterales bacterium]|nr:hypothetical protein [Vicinamibacterales bacterium]